MTSRDEKLEAMRGAIRSLLETRKATYLAKREKYAIQMNKYRLNLDKIELAKGKAQRTAQEYNEIILLWNKYCSVVSNSTAKPMSLVIVKGEEEEDDE